MPINICIYLSWIQFSDESISSLGALNLNQLRNKLKMILAKINHLPWSATQRNMAPFHSPRSKSIFVPFSMRITATFLWPVSISIIDHFRHNFLHNIRNQKYNSQLNVTFFECNIKWRMAIFVYNVDVSMVVDQMFDYAQITCIFRENNKFFQILVKCFLSSVRIHLVVK